MWRKWGAYEAFGALWSDSPVSRESTLAKKKNQALVLSSQALHLVDPDSLMFMGPGSIKALCDERWQLNYAQQAVGVMGGDREEDHHPSIHLSKHLFIHLLFI